MDRSIGRERTHAARPMPRMRAREQGLRARTLPGLHEDIWPQVAGPSLTLQQLLEQPGPQGPDWGQHLDTLRQSIRAGRGPQTMTPREIVAIYQGLDTDRLYWYENGRSSRDWSENEAMMWTRKADEARTGNYRTKFPEAFSADAPIPPAPTQERPGFPRTLEDASTYPRNGHASLHDDLAANGMRSPVSLSADLDTCGLMGRPQVLGGTHRLAVMLAIDPDRPVPVSFHASLAAAQETLGERY